MEYMLKHSGENPRNSEGSFVELSGGRIYFAYTRYCGEDSFDDCNADIYAIISSDEGTTWSAPELVVKNTRRNVMSVSLLRLQDGRIAMHYLEKSDIMGYDFCECRPKIIFSSDECATWSTPVDIADVPCIYYVGNNERLVQLKSGRIIIPYSHHFYKVSGKRSGIGDGTGVFAYSDDGGVTWQHSADRVYPPYGVTGGLMEPGVVELADGSLYCWFRTNAGCQYKAFSCDGGNHWSMPVPAPEFRSPSSPLSMKRDPSTGYLYAVWNNHHPLMSVPLATTRWGARTPLVIARSCDEAKSWDNHFVVENSPDHGYAYTAMYFRGNKLFLAYCCGGEPDCVRMLQDCKIKVVPLDVFDGQNMKIDHQAMNDHGARR